jgi:hypothetical protein
MRVTRRTVLQASLLGVAGVLRAMPTAAQPLPAGPNPAERERLAHLAADLMDWYEAPGQPRRRTGRSPAPAMSPHS